MLSVRNTCRVRDPAERCEGPNDPGTMARGIGCKAPIALQGSNKTYRLRQINHLKGDNCAGLPASRPLCESPAGPDKTERLRGQFRTAQLCATACALIANTSMCASWLILARDIAGMTVLGQR